MGGSSIDDAAETTQIAAYKGKRRAAICPDDGATETDDDPLAESHFSEMAPEIVLLVATFLREDVRALVRLRGTCKRFCDILSDTHWWRGMTRRWFPRAFGRFGLPSDTRDDYSEDWFAIFRGYYTLQFKFRNRLRDGASSRNPPAPPSLVADEASCTVRINGLPPTANDDLVQTIAERYGYVLRVYLARDRVTGAARGFAFVKYMLPQDATEAVLGINGVVLGDTHRLTARDFKPPGNLY